MDNSYSRGRISKKVILFQLPQLVFIDCPTPHGMGMAACFYFDLGKASFAGDQRKPVKTDA